ncbi:MAG: DUF5691 domain-containing protein [Pirellulales bacterium]
MDELTRIALAGLSRAPTAAQPDAQHPAESLLIKREATTGERGLLLRAGTRAVYERCGVDSRADVQAVEAAPHEDRPFASSQISSYILTAMALKNIEALKECVEVLESRNLLLPRDLISSVLSVTDPEMRELIRPLVGKRGVWLSRFNESWRWMTEGVALLNADDLQSRRIKWNEGTIKERCQALAAMRECDPAEGRKWLLDTIDRDKPEHRAALVAECKVGLSPDDEAWLEARLSDRSEHVRAAAVNLLVHLPGSSLAQRMRERAIAILNLRRNDAGEVIGINGSPPEEIDKAWQRDGISAKTPTGRGKRAVWLETVLSFVAPSHWSQQFGGDANKWIEFARSDDFAIPIMSGWTMAAVRFAAQDDVSAAWLRPLWNAWTNLTGQAGNETIRLPIDPLEELLRAMSRSEAEDVLLERLTAEGVTASARTMSLLTRLHRPWSERFAMTYLKLARRVIGSTAASGEYRWANSLITAGHAIPASCIDEALEPWTITKDITASGLFARELERFTSNIGLRKKFLEIAVPEES